MNDWDDPRNDRAQGLKTNGQCLSQTDTLVYERHLQERDEDGEKKENAETSRGAE
jgi:hypothetical protein